MDRFFAFSQRISVIIITLYTRRLQRNYSILDVKRHRSTNNSTTYFRISVVFPMIRTFEMLLRLNGGRAVVERRLNHVSIGVWWSILVLPRIVHGSYKLSLHIKDAQIWSECYPNQIRSDSFGFWAIIVISFRIRNAVLQ